MKRLPHPSFAKSQTKFFKSVSIKDRPFMAPRQRKMERMQAHLRSPVPTS